jgi:hypothetical protein
LTSLENIAKYRSNATLGQAIGCFKQITTPYLAWKSSPGSSVLSVFGIPGCGKTILCSSIIETLQEEVDDRVRVIHHYCDYKNQRSLDPMTIAGTLINELLESIEITDEISGLIENAFKEGRQSPDESEMLQILEPVLDCRFDYTLYVILDGLDEIQESDRKTLFRFVEHFMKCQHSSVKLCVASRGHISTMGMVYPKLLGDFRIQVTASNISSDIHMFVHQIIEKFIASKELMIRDSGLKDEIVQKLAQGAKGMWAFQSLSLSIL